MTPEHLSRLTTIYVYFEAWATISNSGRFTIPLLSKIFREAIHLLNKGECVEDIHSILIRIFELCDMMRSDRRHNNKDNTESLKLLIREGLDKMEREYKDMMMN